MNIKKFCLAMSICVFPMFSFAQQGNENLLLSGVNDITQGVVVEGTSLPVGVELGDTFGEIEATFDAIEEFDLNERFCNGLRCTYTARDAQDAELGQVIVSFTFNNDTSTFTARSMQWTFEDWVTTRGLSLRALRNDVTSQDELLDIYPEGLALFRDRNGRRSISVSARAVGIFMVSNESPTADSLSGRITTVRNR